MTALNQSFQVIAGDTLDVTVSATNQQGRPLDLTGARIVWSMRRSKKVEEVINQKSTDGGEITVVDAQSGVFSFRLTVEDTKDLQGRYYHQVKLWDPFGHISTILIGDITVN